MPGLWQEKEKLESCYAAELVSGTTGALSAWWPWRKLTNVIVTEQLFHRIIACKAITWCNIVSISHLQDSHTALLKTQSKKTLQLVERKWSCLINARWLWRALPIPANKSLSTASERQRDFPRFLREQVVTIVVIINLAKCLALLLHMKLRDFPRNFVVLSLCVWAFIIFGYHRVLDFKTVWDNKSLRFSQYSGDIFRLFRLHH